MVCLFHGDYGPPDPSFTASGVHGHTWAIDASLLKQARNIGEAEAIQRQVLHHESVSWCHQGYSWTDQHAIGWFYLAAFAFVVLPYAVIRIRTLSSSPRRDWRTPLPGSGPDLGYREL
jgi:hypothetical protein